MSNRLVSVVIPIYFEEKLIDELYTRVKAALRGVSALYRHEIVFVNDGSTDRSYELLKACADRDPDGAVRVIELSRNFGHQLAITAGTDLAHGDAVIVMDGDLQDPPEVLPKLIEKWEQGYKVVYGVRRKRRGENVFKLFTAMAFYRLLGKLGEIDIPVDSGDFRLMDRAVVNALGHIREENRYIRGLVSWVGFKQVGLEYERDARYAGETKFTLKKMIRFAFDGITSFSEKPLRFSSKFGLTITVGALAWMLWLIAKKFLMPATSEPGWTSTMVVVLFMGGVQMMCIGILGEYIGRIYRETKDRPLYIVAEEYVARAAAR